MKKSIAVLIASTVYLLLSASSLYAGSNRPKPLVRLSKDMSAAEFSGNIEYGFSKSTIRPIYYSKLDKLARYLIDNNAALTLRGYADSIGTFKGNWALSEKRAVIVKSYLVKKGVTNDKIITTAFGSTKPVTSNQTAQGRQKNRRVEIKVDPINQSS